MKKLFTFIFLSLSLISFAQQPVYGLMYGGNLYSFNIANCTKHLIGNTGQDFADIALTPDGRLFGIGFGGLFQIDTATAAITSIGDPGVGTVALVALNDSILFGEYNSNLYSININNLSSANLGTIGYPATGDFVWYDDDLYMVTAPNHIIKIKLNSSNTAIINVTAIGTNVPGCEAAITSEFTGTFNSIVGFAGNDLIKICQLDGSTQMLCPGLATGSFSSAASHRLATQVPQPVSCSISTSFNENKITDFHLEIFPNPSASEITLKAIDNLKFNFSIYNAQGQVVRKGNVETNSESIDIKNLPSGIYSLWISQNKFIYSSSFIVEK